MVPLSVLGLTWCAHVGWMVVFDAAHGRRLQIGLPLHDALALGHQLAGQRSERSSLYNVLRRVLEQAPRAPSLHLALADPERAAASLVLSPKDPRIAYPLPIADAVALALCAELPITAEEQLVTRFGAPGDGAPPGESASLVSSLPVPAVFQRALEEVLGSASGATSEPPTAGPLTDDATPEPTTAGPLLEPFPCSDRTVPPGDPATWRLVVDGAVEQPLELTYRGLLALPHRRYRGDLQCAQGGTVPDLDWEGVPLSVLLTLARVRPEVTRFTAYGGGYERAIPLAAALHDGALLAYRVNGQPLPPEHGAPLRLVLPQLPGFYGVKWVERLELAAPGTASAS
jgi:hypothetical protein